jgi:hypothetical protein
MFIRKLMFSGAWALIIGPFFVPSAIAKPNFSGTWVRDAGSSDAFTAVVVPIIGPRKNSPGNNFILRTNHRRIVGISCLSVLNPPGQVLHRTSDMSLCKL